MKRKIKRFGNKTVNANMQVTNNKFIVLSGSEVCGLDGPGLLDNVSIKRNEANIVDGKLLEDVTFDSPSAAGSFVVGAACNGWSNWRCQDGSQIDKFREDK